MTEEARNEFDTFKWSDNWAEKINGEYVNQKYIVNRYELLYKI